SVVIVLLSLSPRWLRRGPNFEQLADLEPLALLQRRAALGDLGRVIHISGADHREAADALTAFDVAELAGVRDRGAGHRDVFTDVVEPLEPRVCRGHVECLTRG